MERRRFMYECVSVEEITATDLQEEAQSIPDAQAYIVTLVKPDGYLETNAERPQVLYSPSIGRMGIAWGADATWADVDGVEQGIDMYFNDPEGWEVRQ